MVAVGMELGLEPGGIGAGADDVKMIGGIVAKKRGNDGGKIAAAFSRREVVEKEDVSQTRIKRDGLGMNRGNEVGNDTNGFLFEREDAAIAGS